MLETAAHIFGIKLLIMEKILNLKSEVLPVPVKGFRREIFPILFLMGLWFKGIARLLWVF